MPQVPKCLSAWVPQWLDVLQVPMCPRTWLPKCPSALSAWLAKCSWSARVPQVLECPSAQVPFYYLQFYYYSSRITESLLIIFYQLTRALCMWKVTSHFQLWKDDLNKKKVIRKVQHYALQKILDYLKIQESLWFENLTEYYSCKGIFLFISL